ncbi:XPG domain containing-domain-containing protein [Sphaerosporella brunnea]|uniref:XPG domain containing-domain-containing protein n=1 Tax=Sphaerosporella brunnea TaxID=1250544 RepID=A0A5J5F225_9PEZI|nr:XPG domain containing-domain-containing protein [Sphaerosporella brunnea]
MGIRHLYTHLRPYSRPETFSAGNPTSLYIDGPALCHHIYHHLFNSLTRSGNAFETTLPYRVFAAAFLSYLSRLESSGFTIQKILFDSALPASKIPTRISRLEDSLRKLRAYRSANPSLRSGAPAVIDNPETFFSPTRENAFASRTQHLAAPPFIVAAALACLREHEVYKHLTETVLGEADPFLASWAIQRGGIVLTGDSDLLVFGDSVKGWGVMMMQDLSFTSSGVTARIFRPHDIRAALKFPLLEIAWQTEVNTGFSSLNQILDLLQRIELRRAQGAGGEKVSKAFRREYELPSLPQEAGRLVVEPRIGELLFLARKGVKERKMYLPFLNEDPQRAPAWEVGAGVRQLAYRLLFPNGEVAEVFRRGTRITETSIACEPPKGLLLHLTQAAQENPRSWYAATILNLIVTVAADRNQPGPSLRELTAAATSLLPEPAESQSRQKWTWDLVHLFASVQAGWYSLLLLREVLAFLDMEEAQVLRGLPDVGKEGLLDGAVFLAALDGQTTSAVEAAKEALATYKAALQAREDQEKEEEQSKEEGEEEEEEQEAVNPARKRPSSAQDPKAASSTTKKQKRKKNSAVVDKANMFALLADM